MREEELRESRDRHGQETEDDSLPSTVSNCKAFRNPGHMRWGTNDRVKPERASPT